MPNINEKKTRRLYINAKYHDYHCKISMQMSISTFTQTPFSQNAIQLQTTLNITFDENVLNSKRFNKIQDSTRFNKIQDKQNNSKRFNKQLQIQQDSTKQFSPKQLQNKQNCDLKPAISNLLRFVKPAKTRFHLCLLFVKPAKTRFHLCYDL